MKNKNNDLFIMFIITMMVFTIGICFISMNKNNKTISKLEEDILNYNVMIEEQHEQILDLTEENNDIKSKNSTMEETIEAIKSSKYKLVNLGEYKLTYYCKENYPHICNNGDSTITASGAPTVVGRTVAVDPRIIPFGTELYIEGVGWRVAEDTGSMINDNHIDILVDGHQEALSQTHLSANVWMLVKVKS